MERDDIQRVRDWAERELTMGVGPWAQYHYTKFREAADAILFSMDLNRTARVTSDSHERGKRRGHGHLRLVDNAQPDLEADDWCLCPCDVEPSS
jgi:hypothetical protein